MSPSPMFVWLVDNAVWLCAGSEFGLLLLACQQLTRQIKRNKQLETAAFHARQTSAFWKAHCRAQTQRLAIRDLRPQKAAPPGSPPEVRPEAATLPSIETERQASPPNPPEVLVDVTDHAVSEYDAGPWADDDDPTQPFLLENCKTHVWEAPEADLLASKRTPANDTVTGAAGEEQ